MNKRSANFSCAEINFLLELVEKRKSIIECKKTDRTTSEEKLESWKDLAKDFNARYGENYRTDKVLRTKYENLKKTAKKNFSEDKKQMYATGGGSLPISATSSVDNTVLNIVHSEQIMGLESTYDDDAIINGMYIKYVCNI